VSHTQGKLHRMQKFAQLSGALLLTLAFWLSAGVSAADLHGKVVGVADGDTVTVLDAEKLQHKIRLAGIDAPEQAQAFGQASKKNLSDMVYGKQVKVNWDKRDRYGRIIGKVSIDQVDVCLEQVRRGMAWHYKQYQREQSPADRQAYAAAEDLARANRVGLWHDTNPVAPWDFRHR
jgi:endonuclease YncB( thermonuclease family)